ncbi:MAG: ribonuclease III [Actinomycetota bacterium]
MPTERAPIYDLALTHRSYAFEQSEPTSHNERLEFLGDAVLGVVVTDLIYVEYPELSEGEMARLRASVVNTSALADIGRSIGLGEHIRLGKGEESSGGRDKDSLLADSFEAVVGAVYLDRGVRAVKDALTPLFAGRIARSIAGPRYDVKTALQELVVRRGGFPSYRVASSGPDHDKRFTAHVYVDDELYGVGSGRSKKEAEQAAALEALERIGTDAEGGRDVRAS